MDTTPKYIKMCEKAEEIQELYQEILQQPREAGRKSLKCWVVARIKGVEPPYAFSIQLHVFALINYPANLIDCIWLPRQDQLQEMVKKPPFELLDDFHETINEYGEYPYVGGMGCAIDGWSPADKFKQFTSLEQLWLAFVMHEKYGKHWDNEKEEWVK